jgi:N-terminal domain of anti-restriction factor ArdC
VRKPWRFLPPVNLVSKKTYRGINFFLLSLAGYGSQYWLTNRQAQALGGNVRKGEHGTRIVFWNSTGMNLATASAGGLTLWLLLHSFKAGVVSAAGLPRKSQLAATVSVQCRNVS